MLMRFGNRNNNGAKNDANYLQIFNVEKQFWRAFFPFSIVQVEIVFVLSTTWSDLSRRCVNNVNTRIF